MIVGRGRAHAHSLRIGAGAAWARACSSPRSRWRRRHLHRLKMSARSGAARGLQPSSGPVWSRSRTRTTAPAAAASGRARRSPPSSLMPALAAYALLHLPPDGARIWNAAVASGNSSSASWRRLFDTRVGLLFEGAGRARRVRHRGRPRRRRARPVRFRKMLSAAVMRQVGILCAAALHAARASSPPASPRITPNARVASPRRWPRPFPAASRPRPPSRPTWSCSAAGPFGTDGPGLVERLAGLGVLAADTDPDRVRLVFTYEVTADDSRAGRQGGRRRRRMRGPPWRAPPRTPPRRSPTWSGRPPGSPAASTAPRSLTSRLLDRELGCSAGRQGRAPAAGGGVQGPGGVQRPARPRPGPAGGRGAGGQLRQPRPGGRPGRVRDRRPGGGGDAGRGPNPAKVAATRAYGAEVITAGVTGDNRESFSWPSWPSAAACTWSTPSTTTT